MTVPILSLLGFALWTLIILITTVGSYRLKRIFTGEVRIGAWTADPEAGSGWYPRAMRAHLNAVENLPVFGAIILAVQSAEVSSPAIDALALTVFGGRVLHSIVHIGFEQTDRVATVRFLIFVTQAMAMIGIVAVLFAAL